MRAHNNSTESERSYLPTIVFCFRLFDSWAGFSALATGAQWFLEDANLLNKMMATTSPMLGGGLLLVAGLLAVYSMEICLFASLSLPIVISLMARWRSGRIGTFCYGNGSWCLALGCCWFLMALLFLVG